MSGASKALLVGLRIWQLICSVIVLGILSSFLHRVAQAGAWRDGRIIYGIVTSSISTFFSIVFIAPFLYAFLAFPFDFVMFVMWLVLFCLEMTRTGIHTCSAPWFWNYWGFFWGRWWRRPVVVNGPADIAYSGCSQWRTVLAFSFMAMFAYLISTFLGAYVVSKYWSEKRRDRHGTAANPQTSKIGGPMHMDGAEPGQTTGVAGTSPEAVPGTVPGTGPGMGPATVGQPGTYAATGQPGTYAATGQSGTYAATGQSGTYV